jgi:hypothetical protein
MHQIRAPPQVPACPALPDAFQPQPTAEPLLTELSARLGAVEDLVTVLSGQMAATPDTAATQSISELDHRVRRLRDMVDALQAGG